MSKSGKSSGFSLIELLVVIAIIAILAAILFPVFAKARSKARQNVCLSNLKHIATGATMYLQDYNDTLPGEVGFGEQGDAVLVIHPYVKNWDVFYCPDRTTPLPSYPRNVVDDPTGKHRYMGYGYNWSSGYGSGAKHSLWKQEDGCIAGYYVKSGATIMLGRRIAAFFAPSLTFFYGDTADTPRQTLGHDHMCADLNAKAEPTLEPMHRHNTSNNFAFVDGHAKWLLLIKNAYDPYRTGEPTCQVVPNPCMYRYDYDGSNNPGNCRPGSP